MQIKRAVWKGSRLRVDINGLGSWYVAVIHKQNDAQYLIELPRGRKAYTTSFPAAKRVAEEYVRVIYGSIEFIE